MDLAKYIDHTFLKPDGGADAVRKLCREAKKYGFASVCVNPAEVKLAAKLLKNSGVAVCSVVGFPLGQNTVSMKGCEAMDAIRHGATELDVVINVRLLKHDPNACLTELASIVTVSRDLLPTVVMKLIIECCYLTREEKILACKFAKAAGFDFVKTSTGFGPGGATVEDVKLMRKAVGKKMGVKAAGGIRDKATALAMIEAGANRIGCSVSTSLV